MQELIDRAKVLAEIGEFQIRFNETGDSHERVAYASAEHCKLVIKAAPTVELEVRHGKWIDNGNYAVCSECGGHSGTQYDGVEPIPLMTQFCPNCGSYMREVSEDAAD